MKTFILRWGLGRVCGIRTIYKTMTIKKASIFIGAFFVFYFPFG